MAQIQLYRDFRLRLSNPEDGDTLFFDNNSRNSLRIAFNIRLSSPTNRIITANGNFTRFGLNIYNLSPQTQTRINKGTYTLLSLDAGYRDLAVGGNRNTQPILVNCNIHNAFTFRRGADVMTTFVGISNRNIYNDTIDEEDIIKWSKSKLKDRGHTRKIIFLYFIDKYFQDAGAKLTVKDSNLLGFDPKFNRLESNNIGPTLTKTTTVSQALTLIAADRAWYIDNLNILHVIPVPSSDPKFQAPFLSELIAVNQKTGLLDIPIRSPAGTIMGKTLLNPAIVPLARVRISTITGFQQQQSVKSLEPFVRGAPTLAAKEVDAIIMSASLVGDSRQGNWHTNFKTFPRGAEKSDLVRVPI